MKTPLTELIEKWESEMGSYIPNAPIYREFILDAKNFLEKEKEFVVLTQKELEDICGEFFDKGYYASLYSTDTTDKSVEIYSECKDEILKKVLSL
jgi:hypothetical protein